MRDVKIYSKMIPTTPLQIQCTLVIDNEKPITFYNQKDFEAELKKRKIDLTEIKYQ